MIMVYRTKGTCSQAINVEAENGIVTKFSLSADVPEILPVLQNW